MSSLDLFQKVISDPKFDPYDLFRLPQTFTMKQLTKQYHKKALRYHPDKGGDALKYNIIKYAYSLLSEEYKKRQFKANDFRTLKEQSQKRAQETQAVSSIQSQLRPVGGDFNVQRFNENFEANKMDFERDGGYRDWIEQKQTTSSVPNDPLPERVANDSKAFNTLYSKRRQQQEKKRQTQQTSIQVYKEPEPSYTTKLKFSDVDLSRPNTFNHTSLNPDIHFRDYKDAYTDTEITNVQAEKRETFTSVDALRKRRSSVQHEMSDSDKMKYAAKQEFNKRLEQERQGRIRNQNRKIKQHFDTVSALMLQ